MLLMSGASNLGTPTYSNSLPGSAMTDAYDPHLTIRGSGPPVVLVPGMDGTGELFYRQVPTLARSFRVATFALRDSARSMDVLVADLERSRLGYAGTWLWSRACTTNPLTRHDGPLSILRAYTAAELRALAAAAGLPHARVYREPFFRLALVAEWEPPS